LLPSKIANRIEVVADVDDFKLQVPAGILSDARVNLLGYLRTGHREIWSDPVEIILDGSPPQLGSIRVLPSRKVVKETPLEVSASAHDNNLSGVAGVKVGVA